MANPEKHAYFCTRSGEVEVALSWVRSRCRNSGLGCRVVGRLCLLFFGRLCLYFFLWLQGHKRGSRHFWTDGVVKCETLVSFGIMSSSKRETLVSFEHVGFDCEALVVSGRPGSREVRTLVAFIRFWTCEAAKHETLVAF